MDHGRTTDPLDDPEDLDAGLARERTLLAWNRTGLAFMALGGSVIKLVPVPGICILAMGALIWLMGYAQYRVAGEALRLAEHRCLPARMAHQRRPVRARRHQPPRGRV